MNFYNINHFPKGKGLLRIGLSMANLSTKQSIQNCMQHLQVFDRERQRYDILGCHFNYSDFLYLYSDLPANQLKNSYMNQITTHKNGLIKAIKKNPEYSLPFFSFGSRADCYLSLKENIHFPKMLDDLRKIFDTDTVFQQYMSEDAALFDKTLDDDQIMFFLEEHLMMYLINKGRLLFPNTMTPDPDRVLICYPGPMLKHEIYIYQKNFFKLQDPRNKFEDARYNPLAKKLYDATKIDLAQYNYQTQ